MINHMKKLFLLLAVCGLMAASCKDGAKSGAQNDAPADEPAQAVASADKGFSFDELFQIFSIFGDNIMSPKFAPQSVKDGIKNDLESSYNGYVEFLGPCNNLSYSLFDGDCYDGFAIACYRFQADGHILVILLENGGCDVSSVKYIRAYEYDPETGNAHEVAQPFNPMPKPDDFEDLIRLAGADVASLRTAMKDGYYDYSFRLDGVKVRLNDPMDFDEQVYHGDLVVDYLWNGSELVRNTDYRYACIHDGGFANIRLGEEAPDFHLGQDPVGYGVNYSEGGDLWIITKGTGRGLEVQMDQGKVYSIEIGFPQYCVASYAYEVEPGKQQPYVGARINNCWSFENDSPEVWMLMDGTVQIQDKMWNTSIAFRTPKESLVNPVEPAFNDKVRIENPKFKPEATIESIVVWREN